MRLSSIIILVFYALFLAPAVQGMQKIAEDNTSNQNSFNQSQKNPFANFTDESPSFKKLSTELQVCIADYLTYHDQFRLAQTDRQQFFLWSSTGRVPESISAVTSTSDVTRLVWHHDSWPTVVNQTVIIEVTEHLQEEELERLNSLSNLENILHLHFQADPHKEFMIDIDKLLEKSEFSSKFSSLQSLVFEGVIPLNGRVKGASLQTLQNFIVHGRAIPRNYEKQIFQLSKLDFYRPNLKKISFLRSQLEKETVRMMMNHLASKQGTESRLLEIKENTLDAFGDEIKTQQPWQGGFYFSLKPWIIDEEGNVRVFYRHGCFIPGPSHPRYVTVRTEEGVQRFTWQQMLSFLSPTYFTVVDLIPVIRTWSTEGRLHALTRLIPGSYVDSHSEGSLIFTLPAELQAALVAFGRVTEQTPSEATKRERAQLKEPTFPQMQEELESLKETVAVAASRHSAEVISIPVRLLVNVIRENAQGHSAVQNLLNQLPSLPTVRENMLQWLRDALEFFMGDTLEETQTSNNAEILVGSQLMNILRNNYLNTNVQ